MPGFLRQATASQSRALGPFVDATDFKTPETALTIANTDIKLVVNGGASANKNSGGGTHRVNGVYGVTFDATDTATVGEIDVSVVVAGALPVFDKFTVVEEAVYDALYVAAAPGYVLQQPVNVEWIDGNPDTATWLGAQAWLGHAVTGTLSTTQATTDLTGFGDDILNHRWTIYWAGGTARAYQTAIVTDYVSASGLLTWSPALTGAPANGDELYLIMAASGLAVGDRTGTVTSVTGSVGSVTGAVGSVTGLTAADVGTIKTTTDSILVDTAEIGTAGAGLTNINLPNQTMDVVGNITGNLSGSVGSVTGAVGSVAGAVGSVTGAVGSVTGAVGSVTGFTAANVATILALLDDARAEPGQGTPPANPDTVTKIDYLYKFLRNKIEQTVTTLKVYDATGVAVDQKATVSDDGTTYTRNEIVSGP